MSQPYFPTKILIVTDGTEDARLAIGMAGELTATGSELHLVHVTTVARGLYPDFLSPQQIKRIKTEAQHSLDQDVSFAEASGIKLTTSSSRLGRIDAETLGAADDIGAGLIIIANRTGDALERILLGNEVESVVRHANCPVLVVRQAKSA
ncbi:MAG TPA: universal stress protein [Arenibaculum sp.]|nr:universal stress protein [Arenibaculum sp.]